MKDIFALRLFTRVARLGSFSAAARECGMSQSQASRTIADLEASLGARLLSRTTRAVVPTEAGAEFLHRMEPILDALEEAEQSVREGGELRGILRVAMPTSVAVREVIPRLPAFAERHPALHIQIMLDDRRQDLVRDAADVAIRVGRLPDSSATAKSIATISRVIVAAPSYLARAGTPGSPADLVDHRIVGGPASFVPTAWTFEREGDTLKIDPAAHMSADDNEGAVAAAVAGLGITSTTSWGCGRELADGSLVRLFPGWKTVDIPVQAFFPLGRATRVAARQFIDFLTNALREEIRR
ncbi:LysR family transcriptional regulator [Sphingomonas oligophenolica]|uniref:LysR family transcriptional regulator n=1 Tax=Sphingomonas oligophenolica TaxID=301154 RepID=A0ABU9Y381_9SPHN